ncbi:FKBP-type peptidyl-prolyl cis-trans isomerase [Methylomonas sp. AM2-LC]|uniref:FKBP-type peptidyl-prolyl cis-trans isomerase n=1 Tax=Methylomonas sp. AM2-LC TaxID=3153301 RepID=UPI003264D1A7
MKTHCAIIFFLTWGLFTAAHADKQALQTESQKISYALGVDYIKGLLEDELELDNRAFLQGIQDMQAGKTSRLTAAETKTALDMFVVQRIRIRQNKTLETLAAGQRFLDENQNREGVHVLPRGLQYKVLTQGSGTTSPTMDDGVSVRYRLSDLDGNELLKSPADGKPKKLVIKHLISGWQQALQQMKPGDKWQLFTPPNLAYGENGSPDGRIKPNQTLVYELELVDIVSADEAQQEMDKPTAITTKN